MLYALLYTTASLPMTLGPKAQALSYHVPTTYLFLPNSQAQSLEIPFLVYFFLMLSCEHKIIYESTVSFIWKENIEQVGEYHSSTNTQTVHRIIKNVDCVCHVLMYCRYLIVSTGSLRNSTENGQ